MSTQSSNAEEKTVIAPIPNDAPRCPGIDAIGNTAAYRYTNEKGELLQIIMRIEAPDSKNPKGIRKAFLPYTYLQQADGTARWVTTALPAPRPLYGLSALANRPEAPVMVVEGEKCADAAADAFPDAVVVTWQGGSSGVGKIDFSPLAGRNVVLLPDNDEPGAKAMSAVSLQLSDLGVKDVGLLDMERIATSAMNDAPKGCDIVDALDAGLVVGDFNTFVDKFTVKEDPQIPTVEIERNGSVHEVLREKFDCEVDLPQEFQLTDDGLFKASDDGMLFISSPVYVIGRTRTVKEGAGWGHLLAFQTPANDWDTVVVPSTMLSGDGREMRALLAHRGVVLGQGREERQAMMEFVGFATFNSIVEVATRTGWNGSSFVLPDRVISPEGAPRIMAPDQQGVDHRCSAAGSYVSWQSMAAAVGQTSRGAFAVSVALSAPLAELVGETGGGFHLYGRSSRGKTTLLTVAASVWGGGGRDGAVKSWSMTANGGEAQAALHSGLLLPLDEINVTAPEEIADIIYRLANGQGKARARRDGGATTAAQWHPTILSSGEVTVATRLNASKRSASKVTGGLAVRMIDVPHSDFEDRAFEDIGDHSDEGAFAQWMRNEALKNYGYAGPAFVKCLVNDVEGAKSIAKGLIESFVAEATKPSDDPQVIRVARRFGNVAAAGTLAARWNIVPWDETTAMHAALTCFRAWATARGTTTSQEEINTLQQVLSFFEAHGMSRFEKISHVDDDNGATRDQDTIVRDRCGFRAEVDGATIYYVLPAMWRDEICADLDPGYVAKLLRERGVLHSGEGTHIQKKVRLPDYPNGTRVYVVQPDLLDEAS